MSEHLPIILTSKDFALLDTLVHQWGESFPGSANLIRQKLGRATLVFTSDISPDIVTLNSRVRYRVGDGNAEERLLVAGASEEVLGVTLRLNSARGIALLGAQAGQCIDVRRDDGSTEQISIESVLHQPEPKRARPALTVVSRSELPGDVPKSNVSQLRRPVPYSTFDGDDPGPSAA